MRTIKFRGKRLHDGEWVYGSPLVVDTEKRKVAMIVTLHEAYPDTLAKVTTSVEFNTLGQFTGFDNCFGSEIYEGDILLYCNDNSKNVVVYHKGSFGINVGEQFIPLSQLYLGSDSCYRVVGNVHDNPELLEGGGKR